MPLVKAAPKIDGDLSDDAWKSGFAVPDFFRFGSDAPGCGENGGEDLRRREISLRRVHLPRRAPGAPAGERDPAREPGGLGRRPRHGDRRQPEHPARKLFVRSESARHPGPVPRRWNRRQYRVGRRLARGDEAASGRRLDLRDRDPFQPAALPERREVAGNHGEPADEPRAQSGQLAAHPARRAEFPDAGAVHPRVHRTDPPELRGRSRRFSPTRSSRRATARRAAPASMSSTRSRPPSPASSPCGPTSRPSRTMWRGSTSPTTSSSSPTGARSSLRAASSFRRPTCSTRAASKRSRTARRSWGRTATVRWGFCGRTRSGRQDGPASPSTSVRESGRSAATGSARWATMARTFLRAERCGVFADWGRTEGDRQNSVSVSKTQTWQDGSPKGGDARIEVRSRAPQGKARYRLSYESLDADFTNPLGLVQDRNRLGFAGKHRVAQPARQRAARHLRHRPRRPPLRPSDRRLLLRGGEFQRLRREPARDGTRAQRQRGPPKKRPAAAGDLPRRYDWRERRVEPPDALPAGRFRVSHRAAGRSEPALARRQPGLSGQPPALAARSLQPGDPRGRHDATNGRYGNPAALDAPGRSADGSFRRTARATRRTSGRSAEPTSTSPTRSAAVRAPTTSFSSAIPTPPTPAES